MLKTQTLSAYISTPNTPHRMPTRPRPVPSLCVDMTPSPVWDRLWDTDPQGTLGMPREYKWNGQTMRFWKCMYTPDTNELPVSFWKAFHSQYPQGLKEDPTPRVYDNTWDDSKHGYWRVNDRLQYRHPNGQIYTDVTGADCFD